MTPPRTSELRPVTRLLIFVFTAVLGIETGAGLFTTAAVFPVWAASPESVTGWVESNPFYIEEGDFFMFASPTLALLSIATLIAGWRLASPLRFWLRLSTIIFIVMFVWSVAYFIPVQDVMKGEAGTKLPKAELGSMLRNFVWLNYVRQLSLVVALGAALHALGLSYRRVST